MKNTNGIWRWLMCLACVTPWMFAGCGGSESMSEAVQEAEEAAEQAAETVGEDLEKGMEKAKEGAAKVAEEAKEGAAKAAEEVKEVATELGEKAMAYLGPLKEKFGNLDSLKEKPEELKKAVSGLIEDLDKRAKDLQLPEKIGEALNAAREKLVALRDYLEGEVEQAKIDEHVKEIWETVKAHLGMTE